MDQAHHGSFQPGYFREEKLMFAGTVLQAGGAAAVPPVKPVTLTTVLENSEDKNGTTLNEQELRDELKKVASIRVILNSLMTNGRSSTLGGFQTMSIMSAVCRRHVHIANRNGFECNHRSGSGRRVCCRVSNSGRRTSKDADSRS